MPSHFRIIPLLLVSFLTTTAFSQVEWLPWGEDAFTRARDTAKPIYLSIGDPLNELTRSMQVQTFSNAEIAGILNTNFVCVRVDRDEAPGLAAFGQQWLAAEQKLPGWPLNLWLTPDQLPIEAASYLPPTEEWGREGFMVVVDRVIEKWSADPETTSRNATRTREDIVDFLPLPALPVDDLPAALGRAAAEWATLVNSEHGVFGDPPHNLQPELIRFLLKYEGSSRSIALAALRHRIASAVRDPIDGGFYRGTVDPTGRIPLFQKRLTDQARMALACLDAATVSDDPIFVAAASGALDYTLKYLSAGGGIFNLGEDATSPDLTVTQTWTFEELVALTNRETASLLGAEESGNVDPDEDLEGHHQNRNILHASPLDSRANDVIKSLEKVRVARRDRASTLLNISATAAAHGLLLHVFDRAAHQLASAAYATAAESIRTTLKQEFLVGTAAFTRVAGKKVAPTPEDYLLVALALNDPALALEADTLFYDREFSLYFATATETLGVRPYWWTPTTTDLPAPGVWRLFLADPPLNLIAEIAAPFENPDAPPPGAILLGLSHVAAP